MAEFAGQNWLITPAALAVNQAPPSSISDQLWLVVFSGVYIIDEQGDSANWRNATIAIQPDQAAPLRRAIDQYGIPRPQGITTMPVLNLDQWSPFAAVGAFSENAASKTGVTVNVWRPRLSETVTHNNQPVSRVFSGIDVDIAVRDQRAVFHRLSYHITVLGKIVFLRTVI